MKKLFTIFAALTLAFSAFADKIYFQTTLVLFSALE